MPNPEQSTSHDATENPVAVAGTTGWFTRPRLLTLLLLALSFVIASQVWKIGMDFVQPAVWAISLAVVAAPLHRWITSKVGSREALAAGLSVAVVALVIVVPVALVVQSTAGQVVKATGMAQSQIKDNHWRQTVAKSPRLQRAVSWVESQDIDVSSQLQNVAGSVGKFAGVALAGGFKTLTNLLLTLFFLFFFFRDQRDFLEYTRGLLPFTDKEADTVFDRIKNTIQATLYGTVLVRGLQGALGGLMFWFLGLPGAVLWGVVMAMISIIPVLGAFIIWAPAAIYLGVTGSIGKAIILTIWGVGVIGTVDNVLYPTLVGDRLKMHTVPVFVSMLGGLSLFGTVGLVIGPVVLAVADTLVKIWRQRTDAGKSAETERV